MPKVEVNHIQLHYETAGSGAPVLLIGGLGADTFLWFRQVGELSRRFQVINLDNRGAGESDKPDERYSIPMFATDAAGLLQALGIARAHVVGASLGGLIAQEFALAHPALLDRLVLVSTTFGGRRAVAPSLADHIRSLPKLRRSGDLTADTRSMFELLTTREWFRAHPGVVDEYVAWRVAHPQPPRAYERQRATSGYSVAKRVAQIAVPTLVVHGGKDRIVPVKNAHLLAARIPHAKLAILPNAGHACMIDHADEFNRAVIEFLD